jgi:bifunctional DNase/RNase
MKKIPLKILGLSYSQSNIGSYVLVLSEISGKRKIPVIIRPHEAQHVAIKMESVKSKTPTTYDLMKSITDLAGCQVTEVLIDGLVEGMFYCKVRVRRESGPTEYVSAGVGDALALSLTYGCPLYATKDIMEMAGVIMGDEGQEESESAEEFTEDALSTLSLEGLEQMLRESIENEEYELASQLRDKISGLKPKS